MRRISKISPSLRNFAKQNLARENKSVIASRFAESRGKYFVIASRFAESAWQSIKIRMKGAFMATSEGFKDFVLEQLARCAEEYLERKYAFSARKMFGEYCVYIVDLGDSSAESRANVGDSKKVLFLLCDEIVFIKKFECLSAVAREYGAYFALGYPFEGAKEHYALDIENLELVAQIIKVTLPFLPTPKPRKAHKSRDSNATK